MNLNKYIRISLINLSKKYIITIIEITTAKNKKISKLYRVNYKKRYSKKALAQSIEFRSKRELALWLMELK